MARQLAPDLDFVFEEETIDGKKVVLLSIPATKTAPVSFDNERYIRIGSSKEKLRKYPEKESYLFDVLRHGLPTIENTPSQYQDLTFEKLLIYYGAKGIRLNEDTFKKNLGFYTLDDALRYADVLNVIQADERGRVVERKEVALFENEAFREAMINAFVHNKWVEGNEPMISVFSDRIEILSRGAIPAGQTLDGFFAGESVPVNQKLSEIFLQLHISEKTGRGVPKVVEKYGKEAYEFRENTILVKIPFRWIHAVNNENAPDEVKKYRVEENYPEKGESSQKKFTENDESSQKSSQKITELIKNDKNVTTQKMADILGISRRAVAKQIARMQAENVIRRVGADKGGHWEIVE